MKQLNYLFIFFKITFNKENHSFIKNYYILEQHLVMYITKGVPVFHAPPLYS